MSVECFKGHKPNAYELKYTLDCVHQEERIQYRWQTTYTMGCVSVKCHRIRENNVSKREHVTDTIELVRRRGCPQIRVKTVSRNE